jgi:hypothetical protein
MSSGDSEAEALFECEAWTIEMGKLYPRGVDLTMKMTGVAMKFGREVKVSNPVSGCVEPQGLPLQGYQKAPQFKWI